MSSIDKEYLTEGPKEDINSEYISEEITLGPSSSENNRAAIYTAFADMNNGDVFEQYSRILQERESQGHSPTEEEIKINLKDEFVQDFLPPILDGIPNLPEEEKKPFIDIIPEMVKDKSSPKSVALENLSVRSSESPTMGAKEWSEYYLSNLTKTQDVRRSTAKAIQGVASTFSLSGVDQAIDFADLLLPGQQIALGRVAKKHLGEHYLVLEGNMIRDLASHIRNVPLEEQTKLATEIAQDIAEAAGVTPGLENNIVAAFALMDLEEYATSYNPDDEMQVNRVIGNVAGVLDLLALTPARTALQLLNQGLRSAARASNRLGGDVLDDINKANPNLGSDLTWKAIEEPDVATGLNTTQEGAYATTSPHMPIDTPDGELLLEGAPASVVDKLSGKMSRAEQILDDYENTMQFVDEDFASKELEFLSILDGIGGEIKSIPASSSVTRIPGTNKLNITATYGADSDFPLPNLLSAMTVKGKLVKALKDSGVKSPDVKLLTRDPDTGVYKQYNQDSDLADQPFLVSYKTTYDMTENDIVYQKSGTRRLGSITKFTLSPLSSIERTLISGARVARDKKFILNREILDVASPFTRLADKPRGTVVNLLRQGEKDRQVYSYRQLVNEYDEDVAEGYVSARLAYDMMHRQLNIRLRDSMQRSGFKAIRTDLDDGRFFENAGVPIDDWREALEVDIDIVFDVKTGKPTSISNGDIHRRYLNGDKLVKLQTKVDSGSSGKYSYAWVKGNDITDLPDEVLPYVPGYNLRINNDPYFITKGSKRYVDGKLEKVEETVAVARSAAEAKAAVKWLRLESPKYEFNYHIDRNISTEESALKTDEFLLGTTNNPLWYKKRGERLLRLDGTESSVEDPVTSIEKAAAALSNSIVHSDFIKLSLARHRESFKDVEVNGTKLYEWNKDAKDWKYNGYEIGEVKDPRVKAANRQLEYIQAMTGMPTKTDLIYREQLRGIDEFLSQYPKASKLSGKAISTIAKTTPGSFARTVTFYSLLALDPPRQLLLNALNGLHLMGVSPKNVLTSYKDAKLLSLSMATWDDPELWAGVKNTFARGAGYTPQEWEEVFTAFRESGKGYSIDSHVVVAESNYGWSRSHKETAAGLAGRKATNLAKSPFVIGKNLGFNAGEFYNQAFSYMFAKKMWEKKNPGLKFNANQQSLNEITDMARTYAVDMTLTDAFPYQKGALAAFTQFTAFSHKALLNTLPKSLGGNPDYEGYRARYLLGMVGMYGLSGWGLQELYNNMKREYGVEVPPELDNAIQGGFSDLVVNTAIDSLSDAPFGTNRLRVGESISMGASQWTFPFKLVENLFDGNIIQAMAGPSGKVFPSYYDAAIRVKQMWGFDDLDTSAKIVKSLDILSSNFGVFSKMFQYNAAMAYAQEIGEFHNISKTGGFAGKSTHAEQLGKLMFGIGNESQNEFYNSWIKLNKEYTGKSGEKILDNDAKQLAWWLNQAWIESGGDEVKFYEKSNALTRTLHRGNEAYGDKVLKRTRVYLQQQPNYEDMIMNIANKSLLMDNEAIKDQLINMVKSSALVPDQDDKERIIYMIEAEAKSITNSNELSREEE